MPRRVQNTNGAGRKSLSVSNGGSRVLRRSPIKQDERGRGAHVGVQHTGATARAGASWDVAKAVPHQFSTARKRAG
jgi:hypothetical protein